jgi:hypothetical protein
MSASAATQQPNLQSAAPQIPDDERLHRLVVEAGKYLGLRVGDSLPITEVVTQGEANGYSETEVYALLEHEGLPTDDRATIPVPTQGDVFGELWRTHRTPQATFSTIPEVQELRQWLAQQREKRCTEYEDGTHQHKVQHAYSLHTARKRSGQAKDVGRHFIKEYDRFTTVIVTYCAEKEPSDFLVEQGLLVGTTEYFAKAYVLKREHEEEEHHFGWLQDGVSELLDREGRLYRWRTEDELVEAADELP